MVSEAEGRGFDPRQPHHTSRIAIVTTTQRAMEDNRPLVKRVYVLGHR